MNIARIILKEILHRKTNFIMGICSIAMAAAFLMGILLLLQIHDWKTERVVLEKEREMRAQMGSMEDEYRKITKKMGFNVLVLPKNQNLADFYADDQTSLFMPESYAQSLAQSSIVTVQHLLPMLQQKVKWPEQRRTVLLIGVRDEIPIAHEGSMQPILKPVPPDTVTVGYELCATLRLKKGDSLRFMGRDFKIHECQEERGGKDDITIWMNLNEAQELLGKEGLITGIMALECKCALANLPKVRKEIEAILPDTQVVEFASKALARAEARQQAEQTAQTVVNGWKENRAQLRQQKESFASILAPLLIIGAGIWVGLLAYGNARDRRAEIGILRTLGLSTRHILVLFLGKAMIIGLTGAILGALVGAGIGFAWGGALQGARPFILTLLSPMITLIASAPVLATLASWLPALWAAQQDPAVAIREE